jgi:hypothetical protein
MFHVYSTFALFVKEIYILRYSAALGMDIAVGNALATKGTIWAGGFPVARARTLDYRPREILK